VLAGENNSRSINSCRLYWWLYDELMVMFFSANIYCCSRVGLAQLVRFLVVELTHSSSNPRFNMVVAFMTNYFLVGGNVLIDSETLLVIDFVNLKIKPAQSFGGDHRSTMCVHVFIEVSAHTYMSICVCPVFLKIYIYCCTITVSATAKVTFSQFFFCFLFLCLVALPATVSGNEEKSLDGDQSYKERSGTA
jgi:hypothetical protein